MKTIELKNENIKLKLVPEFGCHWASLEYQFQGNWLALLYPVPDIHNLPNRPYHDGSYILAPWSNRLEKAEFDFKGQHHQLKPNFPDGTAIHGDVWTRKWTVTKQEESQFEAKIDSGDFEDFNYPFHTVYYLSISLEKSDILVNLKIENKDSKPGPVGLGFHPFWNRRLTKDGSDLILKLPANRVYPTVIAMPQSPAISVEGKKDLRQGKDLNDVDLDDCFTELTEQKVVISYPKPGINIEYELDPIFGHVVVYAPMEASGRPKDFVAVEPVTNVTNGFNLLEKGWKGTGVKTLDPRETWGGTWKISILNTGS